MVIYLALVELNCYHDNPRQMSCHECYVGRVKCEWAPSYKSVVKVSGGSGGHWESIEVQQEVNAIC